MNNKDAKQEECNQELDYTVTRPTKGDTSYTFYLNGLFMKFITKWSNYNVYEREKYIASILNKFDFFSFAGRYLEGLLFVSECKLKNFFTILSSIE